MISLAREHWAVARRYVTGGRAGLLFAPHMVATGVGDWWVDAWPDPASSLLFVGGNLALAGVASRVDPAFVGGVVQERLADWDRIFVDAPSPARSALGPLHPWRLRTARGVVAPRPARRVDAEVRRLAGTDAEALAALDESLHWIGDTWGGFTPLVESGRAWGAVRDGTLAAVAAPGFVGDEVEDVFIVTEPAWRGRALAEACAGHVLADVRDRGRDPSWTTWPENRASLRVAAKLGFSGWSEHPTWIAGAPM